MGKEKTLGETLLELPLYGKEIKFTKKDGSNIAKNFINLLYEKGWNDSLYSFCNKCGRFNTFKLINISLKAIWESEYDLDEYQKILKGPIMLSYKCPDNNCEGTITIVIDVDGYYGYEPRTIEELDFDDPPTEDDYDPISNKADFFSYDVVKIGQYPTIADLEKNSIDSFRKIIPKEKIREYKKAWGLFSHGVATGAMAYLRRVFEYLLEEAHKEAIKKDSNFDADNNYFSKRISEKIELLRSYVPDFMFEQRNTIYGIVSKGIHELPEEENNKNFKVIAESIEIILSEKLRKYLEEERKEEVKKALQESAQKIKTK